MTLTEFLLARIAEDEAGAYAILEPLPGQYDKSWQANRLREYARRTLAECEAKRQIVELHRSWPVLIEKRPPMEPLANVESMVFRMSLEIAWLTQQEYVNRFGTEPPTAPMLRALALPYAGHPYFRQEWAVYVSAV